MARAHFAAVVLVFGCGRALAEPVPNIVIEAFEFVPTFAQAGSVQVVAANNKGDFCGYVSGLPPREFRCFSNGPVVGSFDVTFKAMNDEGDCVGNSFQVFPPFGIKANGLNSISFFSGLGFDAINNKGWTIGKRFAAFGSEPRVRIDDLGETDIPGVNYWTVIDDEGRIWGTTFSGENETIVMKTRFKPQEDLGSFGGDGAKVRCVNRHGDFGGSTYSNSDTFPPTVALAVIGDVEHHIPTQTGNDAFTLAVTVDGQIIGTDRGMCTPACDGLVWVVKDGVRHNLDDEISAFLGFFPTLWSASAASETGWIIGQATDPRDNSFHLFRMKIQVDLDSDGDGLLDFWESENGGIDFNHDNVIDFKPWDHGARPDHKDLFIEVDAGTIPLADTAVSKVLFAFENAPVNNPDGSTGIHLHIDRDESGLALPNATVVGAEFPAGFKATKAQHFGTFEEQTDDNSVNLLRAKSMVYRYCVLYDGLEFLGNSKPYNGVAEIGGNDFVVDFAAFIFKDGFRDDDDRAATFMHEFGHTLGLYHSGTLDEPNLASQFASHNGKPNYPSIMNYALAHPMRFSNKFWTLDYSREKLADLNESGVSEAAGIFSTKYKGYFMPYGVGSDLNRSYRLVRLDGRKTDFNASGAISGSPAVDLNFLGANSPIAGTQSPSPGDRMRGFDDWSNLQYRVITDEKEHAHDITLSGGCPNSESVAFLDANINPPCDADFNGDGLVEDADFSFFVVAYNTLLCDEDDGGGGDRSVSPIDPSPDCPADLNADRLVDDADFSIFIVAYNELVCP